MALADELEQLNQVAHSPLSIPGSASGAIERGHARAEFARICRDNLATILTALRSAERKEPVEASGLVRGLREKAREASAYSWWSKLEETTEWRAADALAARDAEIAELRAVSEQFNGVVEDRHSEIADLKRELAEAREVLAWYGEQARLARLIHSEGDPGRASLATDGGNRARAFLARQETNPARFKAALDNDRGNAPGNYTGASNERGE